MRILEAPRRFPKALSVALMEAGATGGYRGAAPPSLCHPRCCAPLPGERPYCCDQCGKQFTQLNALQRHHRIHTGEKPFMCNACGRTFTDKSTLRRHTSVRPCPPPAFCPRAFFHKHADGSVFCQASALPGLEGIPASFCWF